MIISNKNNKYVRTLCAILFCVFTLLYLYFYQADIMMFTQHVCSDGQTHYHRVVGALLVTFILMLIQFGVGRLFKQLDLLYALSYLPSLMLLTALTSIRFESGIYSFGPWGYVLPIMLVFFILVLCVMRKVSYDTRFMYHYSIQILTLSNLAIMLLSFLGVLTLSNSSYKLHVQLKAERLIMEKNYDEALDVLAKNDRPDSSLTMLTAFALAHKGELGERLFCYPLTGGSAALTPDNKTTRLAMCDESHFYDYIGVWTKQKMGSKRYLDYLLRHRLGKKPFADYFLSSLLLDKELDKFVYYIMKFYNVRGLLPTHYREALLLYTHLRTNPVIIFHSTLMEADFQDFQDLENKYGNKTVRKNMLRDMYGNTYWYYYFYQ